MTRFNIVTRFVEDFYLGVPSQDLTDLAQFKPWFSYLAKQDQAVAAV